MPTSKEIRGKLDYKMTEPQLVQLDCRVETCFFYNGAGKCINPSPAITLNPGKTFVCWTYLNNDTEKGK